MRKTNKMTNTRIDSTILELSDTVELEIIANHGEDSATIVMRDTISNMIDLKATVPETDIAQIISAFRDIWLSIDTERCKPIINPEDVCQIGNVVCKVK